MTETNAPAAVEASSPVAPTAAKLLVSGTMAGEWTLARDRSYVEFTGKHLWGAIKVRGRFTDVTGSGVVADDHTVSGRLEIISASIDTKSSRRAKQLRSVRFLDAEAHPRIVLTAVDVTVEAHDRLVVQGSIEVRGAARPVSFGVHILEATSDHVCLDAQLIIDRTDFGITWSPIRMASNYVVGHVVAHFVRPH